MASNRAICQLDNGMHMVYHAAAPIDGVGEHYDRQVFEYLGTGTIYEVAGVLQRGDTRLRFYCLKPDRPRWAR